MYLSFFIDGKWNKGLLVAYIWIYYNSSISFNFKQYYSEIHCNIYKLCRNAKISKYNSSNPLHITQNKCDVCIKHSIIFFIKLTSVESLLNFTLSLYPVVRYDCMNIYLIRWQPLSSFICFTFFKFVYLP